jgi:protease IV
MTDSSEAESTPVAVPPDPHEVVAANALRRSRRRWRIAAVIALAVVVIVALGRFVLPGADSGQDHIARVVVDGIIAHNPARLRALAQLAEDEHVKGVVVAINSPGGTSAGGEELYSALLALGEAKPIVASINELGASAAYMTAIAADRIFARRMSMVGSIGVYIQHVNAAGLFDTLGIDLDKVASAPLKGEPEYDAPMSPEVRASLQALVDDSYQFFVDIVAERRGLSRPVALALADGRIMSGGMTLENGLIDEIGGEIEAIDWLENEHDLSTDLPVITRYPLPASALEQAFGMIGSQMRAAIGLPSVGAISLDGLNSLWQADL